VTPEDARSVIHTAFGNNQGAVIQAEHYANVIVLGARYQTIVYDQVTALRREPRLVGAVEETSLRQLRPLQPC